MRVISGTYRRRTLLGPHGNRVTRPIPDRVKQSLFDRLWSSGALECAAALDIFAGTGSLGIEALSRGVVHCSFIERDRSARALLEQNLANLGLAGQATVLAVDVMAEGWIGLLDNRSVGLVFCDPPYKLTAEEASMKRIAGLIGAISPILTPGATLVLRTDNHTQTDSVPGWLGPSSYSYGSTTVHFYQRSERAKPVVP